jgi:hypothetical protein
MEMEPDMELEIGIGMGEFACFCVARKINLAVVEERLTADQAASPQLNHLAGIAGMSMRSLESFSPNPKPSYFRALVFTTYHLRPRAEVSLTTVYWE